MSSTPDLATCLAADDDGRGELLPLSPFNSLHYHFGMLLGVDDFETEQAYHRAKMRLHNAWLHREGVAWGFGVGVDEPRGEIRVTPGLALDAAGHELHLEADACVNVGQWFDEHHEDPDFTVETNGDARIFDAHVAIRFKACLTRQVPALMEPCDNGSTGAAYSRVFETLEILLLPNLAPPRVYPYHRLRLLFGLDEPRRTEGESPAVTPEDQAVLDEVDVIRALPPTRRPAAWAEAFQQFAALDEIDMKPATSEDGARTLLFPGREDDPVVLANITGLTLTKKNGGWELSGGTVDTAVRPVHVATTTIQDLLCGLPGGVGGAGGPAPLGPRVDPASVVISDTEITLSTDQQVHGGSIDSAFSVSVLDPATGWKIFPVTVEIVSNGRNFRLLLTTPPLGKGLARVIARGTGETPLIGVNSLPLAGATTDAPAPQGADFVLMKERN
jgi:hypothetical protein